ncbi:MAG TPA: GAF domain-containing protein [Candidatus Deferrimicrobiaceae bacterium]|nr:GAF domain-containing protein [Candidatus Deferrimicrobiaceae bacterium]
MDNPPDRKFSLLSRVIEISNSNIQVENRLKYICDYLVREAEAECVCIYRRDPRGEYLIPWVSSCVEIDECTQFDFRIRPGEGVAGKAIQKRAPVFFPDVQASPPPLSVARENRDFRSILSVPIMDDVYLYGAMNFSGRSTLSFSEETVRLLSAVATEVAGAIRNSRLYHDARKRVSELITLNEIGRAITSTFHVRDILGYVAKTTSRLLQSDGCTIRLVGERRSALKVMADEGYDRPSLKREMRAHGKLLAHEIFREKRPLLLNGPEDSPLFLALAQQGITSFLGLPIISKGRALGVINYYSCSPQTVFDIEVMHLMQTVCNQLANMIENSAMYREAQQLAQENQARAQRFAMLYNVARALMSTVKTERLLQIMLFALTSPMGFNFSRAILYLLSEDGRTLSARMGMGPRNAKEARRAAQGRKVLPGEGGTEAVDRKIGKMLWDDMEHLSLPMTISGCLVVKAVRERRAVRTESGCGACAAPSPRGLCGNHPSSFATVPLVVQGEARGAIYVDNRFREREITEEDIQILTMFASEACLALENTSLYESLEVALDKVRKTQDRLVQSEKLAALGEMAARIAHEIKNPLTVIGGFAGRLSRLEKGEGHDRPPTARYAEIILKEVKRLERTIQQTLYFSREVVPAFQPVEINAEIRDILGMFRDELEEYGIEKAVELSEKVPEISVDPDQIRQVLWNLVSNAIQAMEKGGTLTLVTRPATKEEGDGVVILVGDTGGGIPHDVVHNIFNPFFTTKPKGTGLGLPIVHAIVQNHGGTIQLDNREGEGVMFSIFLPREPKEKGTGGRILEQMRKGDGNGTLVREHSG